MKRVMFRFSTTYRIALCLAIMALNVMLIGKSLGLFPNEKEAITRGRVALCESVAISCSLLANKGDLRSMEQTLHGVLLRNEDVLSAGIRDGKGEIVIEVGDHKRYWQAHGHKSDANILVPITAADEQWGRVELAFSETVQGSLFGVALPQFAQFTIFATCLNGLVFLYILRKFLKQLDPSKVVPDRVRSTLDTLAEGVLVLDQQGRIVLANDAFTRTIGREAQDLQGSSAADLPWGGRDESEELPWFTTIQSRKHQTGVTLTLETQGHEQRTFMVNASPILDDRGQVRGVLASFDDITPLEKKKAELLEMLSALKRSREEIQRQNEQLRVMATRDPLTGCLNRRAFFEEFSKLWTQLESSKRVVTCLMLDVDHFKNINDSYGHSTGDDVLRGVAALTMKSIGSLGHVCRFGGEEFCVVLPEADLGEAVAIAERLRMQIEEHSFVSTVVTVSIGVSASGLGATNPQELLDQADKSLYIAKRHGRNRVMRWDQAPQDIVIEEKMVHTRPRAEEEKASTTIPFHAVSALMSALAFRDDETAAHSARVADYCVRAARDLMGISDVYIVEIAALLHDIGKIGVPDAILLKPGRLSDDEWKVMKLHDRMGVEIVNAAFACDPLIEIIATHHAKYGGDPAAPYLPVGDDIPLGARILTIADSFDAMVSDRVYRRGRTFDEAFTELRRCAGTQFDPTLVEHFIKAVQDRSDEEVEMVRAASKQTGLYVGLQIERLAEAVDHQDLEALASLAGRLETMAAKHELNEIHAIASQLRELATNDVDLAEIVRLTLELMDMCRSTQNSCVRLTSDLKEIGAMRRRIVYEAAGVEVHGAPECVGLEARD